MDTALSEVLVFKLFRAGTATLAMAVITLDITKHRRPHYFPAGKAFSVDTFHFQRMKEAFHIGIIITATFRAHTSPQIVPFQQSLVIHRPPRSV